MPRRRNFRPVLSQIRLKNFKSVKEAQINLKQLTVVVGKNSSGKSTLLQAILILVQAVSKRGGSRSFPLNGELIKLGSFNEVKNFSDKDENGKILLGFTVNHNRPVRTAQTRSRGRSNFAPRADHSMSWDGIISSPVDQTSGSVMIDGLQFKVETSIEDRLVGSLSIDIARMLKEIDRRYGEESHEFNPFAPSELNPSLIHKVEGQFRDGITGESSSIDMLSLQGGLPNILYRADSKIDAYAKIWWKAYSEILSEQLAEVEKTKAERPTNRKQDDQPLKQAYKDIRGLTETGKDEDWSFEIASEARGFDDETREFFKKCAGRLTDTQKKLVAKGMVVMQEARFRDELKTYFKEEEWSQIVHSEIWPSFFSRANIWGAISFFHSSVKYLGPLRQEPQPVYDPGPEREDLGIHGEYTAGVLLQKSQQKQTRRFPLPDGRTEDCTFSEALGQWLNNFDLVKETNATDRGRLGIGLEVVPQGTTKSVDLTSVGVGVSQVLPVLVLCLVSAPNQFVMIEQPELHLHPAMQLKLADFLLECARSGRQLLVETHSEHIVNRLRRRSLESPDENGNLVRLLFAEQENGNTSYRSSDVNENGGLDEDWPEGFLDVGANEAADFMRVSIGKIREKNKK